MFSTSAFTDSIEGELLSLTRVGGLLSSNRVLLLSNCVGEVETLLASAAGDEDSSLLREAPWCLEVLVTSAIEFIVAKERSRK